ncbi:ABC transporter ATP-binding protein [uncultured Sphingomonas sp.]|uniref:ABC transporter ATP-binding protein n=1 Tax=uncultured Sphingomonas sp. TaxID=158754 RepID=UPI0035CC81C8
MTEPILSVRGVSKTYASGVRALHAVDLDIDKGEIFALLGPNGAGKTTLISIICGIVTPSTGTITVGGHDAIHAPARARRQIGLVPQELATDMFETVLSTCRFSRGLFGYPPHAGHIDQVLKDLSLYDRRNARIMELSGGMKRRVLIAKALAHEPDILFLDEPTAGVDVALRRDMWQLVHRLRAQGTTIILTTHYIEEAEEMADRVGVIAGGKLLVVDEKAALMKKLGKRKLDIALSEALVAVPAALGDWRLSLEDDGRILRYVFDTQSDRNDIPGLMQKLVEMKIGFKDLETSTSSLEDIFVDLVGEGAK